MLVVFRLFKKIEQNVERKIGQNSLENLESIVIRLKFYKTPKKFETTFYFSLPIKSCPIQFYIQKFIYLATVFSP